MGLLPLEADLGATLWPSSRDASLVIFFYTIKENFKAIVLQLIVIKQWFDWQE